MSMLAPSGSPARTPRVPKTAAAGTETGHRSRECALLRWDEEPAEARKDQDGARRTAGEIGLPTASLRVKGWVSSSEAS